MRKISANHIALIGLVIFTALVTFNWQRFTPKHDDLAVASSVRRANLNRLVAIARLTYTEDQEYAKSIGIVKTEHALKMKFRLPDNILVDLSIEDSLYGRVFIECKSKNKMSESFTISAGVETGIAVPNDKQQVFDQVVKAGLQELGQASIRVPPN